MKNTRKKGFTIVELVIVIAVIAILAAVLIPTFSNIIKKANLSADKQAVREMNMALAEEEATAGYAKPQDVETAMRILANHGYDAVNWTALSAEYKVMWDSKENRMILVRNEDGVIEYPEEYFEEGITTTGSGAAERFKLYNQNNIAALATNFSFDSNTNTSTNKVTLGSNANATIGQSVLSSALTGSNVNANIKSALGLSSGNAYVAASTVSNSATYSSGTYASCESLYVTDDDSLVITADLLSTGKFSPNVYVVSVTYNANASAEEKLAAEQAAGEYVYSLFVQMNSGKIEDNASIIIPAGTKINCASHEWQAVKSFRGYFGTPDSSNPVIIDGMRLTTATGYAQTYAMNGSASKYFMTGFIGVINGTSTVENLTFKNVTIKSPGADFTIANDSNNRNTVGIIGGILPDNDKRDAEVEVTLRNIVVENSCSVIGESSVGGLVGYIGAEQGYTNMKGTINIEGCKIGSNVESLDSIYVSSGYGPAGGIIGFTCRCGNLTINISESEYTGTVKGYGYVGGIIGDHMGSTVVINLDNVSDSEATITSAGLCTDTKKKPENYGKDIAKLGSIVGHCEGSVNYKSNCSFKDNMNKSGAGGTITQK